jgi:predicted DNA-binding protein YlxM (UPF0122 family)
MKKEYLTVNEFAEAAGLSRQAVYKKLNNQLTLFVKVVNNKKMIEKSALELFKEKRNCQPVEQQLNNKLIEMLRTELDRKNEQIENLQQALDQAQRLHAMDKQRILELECKEEPEEPKKKKWWQRKK